jgi:hypothetical protein
LLYHSQSSQSLTIDDRQIHPIAFARFTSDLLA